MRGGREGGGSIAYFKTEGFTLCRCLGKVGSPISRRGGGGEGGGLALPYGKLVEGLDNVLALFSVRACWSRRERRFQIFRLFFGHVLLILVTRRIPTTETDSMCGANLILGDDYFTQQPYPPLCLCPTPTHHHHSSPHPLLHGRRREFRRRTDRVWTRFVEVCCGKQGRSRRRSRACGGIWCVAVSGVCGHGGEEGGGSGMLVGLSFPIPFLWGVEGKGRGVWVGKWWASGW